MDMKLHGHTLWQGLVRLVDRVVAGAAPGEDLFDDSFYEEIYQIEEQLTAAPTRSTRALKRWAKMPESLREHQKFIDLSG